MKKYLLAPQTVLAGSMLILAMGCAHQKPSDSGLKEIQERSCQEPEELLDVLAKFSTAVNKRDYHKAISYLSKEDQAKMVVGDGIILEDMQRKLSALNFQTLANNKKIDLVHGKLTGVFECLPCLDQAEPVKVAEEPEPILPAKPIPADTGVEKVALKMAKEFYQATHTESWDKAKSLVHPQEWEVFLDSKGVLTQLSKRRLRAIQECDLAALTLTDGALTGVVLLLDPPVSELFLQSTVFFNLVKEDKIAEAMGMILETEKKFFRDKDGNLRPDRIAQLKALDPKDWRKLYLYHNVLIGVAEAAIGYQNL